MVCQDKHDVSKQQKATNTLNNLESCVEEATQDSIKSLAHLAETLKASLSINSSVSKN